MRDELLNHIHRKLDGVEGVDNIERFTLHYLAGKVKVEILMSFHDDSKSATCYQTEKRFRDALRNDPLIESVDVFWH